MDPNTSTETKTDDATGAPEPEPKGGAAKDEEKRFTQADLEAQIDARLRREREKQAKEAEKAKKDAEAKALKEQGEWKALAEEREAAQAEEAKRAEAAIEALKHERLGRIVERLARSLSFHDPEDAFALANLSKVPFDDEGHPDEKAIKAALELLAKTKPHLIEQPKTPGGNAPRRTGGPAPQPTLPEKRVFKTF